MNKSVLLRPGFDRPLPRKALSVALGVADVELAERLAAAVEGDGMVVSVRARNITTLLSQLDGEPVDAVVVDRPAKRQAEVRASVRSLIAVAERAPALLLCDTVKRGFVRTALKAGAHGILLIADAEKGLPAAIHAACAGHVVISAQVAYGAMESAALSHREKQVLGMVVMGYTNRQISEKLYLAESTVKGHLSSTFDKLGVNSRSEAAALILDPSVAEGAGIPQLWKVANGNGAVPIDRSQRVDGALLGRRKAS
jgi:DNA-binding NarL/FixJ family response regulator